MIQPAGQSVSPSKPVKAVGLLSGGLDSTLAAKVVKDLGVEVHGVYFSMPWGCCERSNAQSAAEKIGIKFIVLQLDERYLEVVRKPKYGYGTALNPCVDCRIHMFTRAAKYCDAVGADFVFTGEVLGQRPMSQMRHSMRWIEEGAGLVGRLLRPLCAQHLEPTVPEQQGLIDREKLLALSGRSRKEQMDLAEQFGITDYPAPAGGCLLTDDHFASRMRDTLRYGYRNFRETVALKWGRHFRINDQYKAILGRDEEENMGLISYAHPDDHILELPDRKGPTCILKGPNPPDEILALCAGLIQRYSRYKNDGPKEIRYYPVSDKNAIKSIFSTAVADAQFEAMHIA